MKRNLFSEEHDLFRDSVKTFIAREIVPHHAEWRQERAIPRAAWRSAGANDLLGISIPAAYGGAETDDYRFNVILAEELASVGLALASSFGIHTDVVAPYLLELTTEEQRTRWLPQFCTGERITAIAMTEPEAGSDLAGLRTRAERAGDGWRLTGSKTFITNGIGADLIIVAARTGDSRRDMTLFVVESEMEGVSRGRKLDKVGQPEADTAELFFQDVELSEEHVLGEVDNGFGALMERLPQERLSSAVVNVAHAEAVLAHTLTYVGERHAFGRPIGSFQHNRFLLAELITKLDVTRAFIDRCVDLHCQRELSAVDAAKAKWWSAEIQNEVIDACVQLYGGYGYMREYDVANAWMDARVTKIWAGSNEIMKEIIGRSLGYGDPRA